MGKMPMYLPMYLPYVLTLHRYRWGRYRHPWSWAQSRCRVGKVPPQGQTAERQELLHSLAERAWAKAMTSFSQLELIALSDRSIILLLMCVYRRFIRYLDSYMIEVVGTSMIMRFNPPAQHPSIQYQDEVNIANLTVLANRHSLIEWFSFFQR